MTTDSRPSSVVETLRMAREVIADPKRWTKGALAKSSKRAGDFGGLSVNDPKAGAWCAVGAIARVDGPHEDAALRLLAEAIDGSGNEYVYAAQCAREDIINFNDTNLRRHKEVLRKFDAAIVLAEQKENSA